MGDAECAVRSPNGSSMAYEIVLNDNAAARLSNIRKFDRTKIRDAIELHLRYEPTRESRSRIKKLIQPAISQFRLRVGEFRVYYDVAEELREVRVVQIQQKGTGVTPREDEL